MWKTYAIAPAAAAALLAMTGTAVASLQTAEVGDPVQIIDRGHADLLYPELGFVDGAFALRLRARDDRLGVVDWDDIVITGRLPEGPDHLLTTPVEDYTDDLDYSFIAPPGSTFWNFGQSSSAGGSYPWVGASTESPTLGPLRDAIAFRLDAVTGEDGGPPPGSFIRYQGDPSNNGAGVQSTRLGLPDAWLYRKGSHSHFNWAFTEPGVYCLAFTALARLGNGARLVDSGQLTFAVGVPADEVQPCGRVQDHPGHGARPTVPANADAPIVLDGGINRLRLDLTSDGVSASLNEEHRYAAGLPTRHAIGDVIFHREVSGPPYRVFATVGSFTSRDDLSSLLMDTASIAPAAVDGDITWRLTGVDGPGDLRVTYQWDTSNQVFFDTAANVAEATIVAGTTLRSPRWEFTDPGKYCVGMAWTATTGGQQVSDEAVMTVVVDGPGFEHDDSTLTTTCEGVGSPPDPDGASQRIIVSVDDTEGALVISVDPHDRTVNLPGFHLAPDGSSWETTGQLRPVGVTDTRAAKPGWTASGQVSDFAAAHGSTFSAAHLGWTPAVFEQPNNAEVAAGDHVDAGFPDGDGLSVARTLASASAGTGAGTSRLGADLHLRVPAETPPGEYRATLTFTAI